MAVEPLARGGRGPAARPGGPLSDAGAPLHVGGLAAGYDSGPVLRDVDYTARAGTLTAILGPNGAGKSTFLKAVLGLAPRLAGHVRVFGRPAGAQAGRIAYVPQRSDVDWDFPASALDVAAMGLYGRIGWLRPVRRRHRARALEMLDRVGLANLAGRRIGALSGGQRQRVFIARALAQEADIYLLDEPLAGVDAATEARVMDILRAEAAAGRTVLACHHDLSTVADYFTHALVLNGRAVASGPLAEAFVPAALDAAYGARPARARHGAAAGAD